ncbi:MAG: serine/threonine protein kinase [Myxococcota bacterium]|nr:serine/threonine protein kinase [Myxococcota bacterium]
MIGETVGNFKIVSKLSIGGMGTVYKAEHTLIGKDAAVKVLHPELSNDRDILNRFFNEAKATTTIKHPGIVEIFDYGLMASGSAYLTMEFLEGVSLARAIKKRGPMSEGAAAMLLRAVCSALGAAHAKGIIHRDLKPDNIFLTPDPDSATGERPKLLDFGIAKLTDIGLAGTATKTGAVMGTPTYMSPEQCRGTGDVDERADLYSIGCIFYELVTGSPPFTNAGAGELIGAHLYLEPEPPTVHLPDLCPHTVKLIMALLRKNPSERPQTAKELGQRLSALAQTLGWITASSPAGVTAPVLKDLATRAEAAASSTSPLYTPDGSEDAAHDTAALQPTTLSGAASQVDLQRKRSRRGLGLAMVAAALLAGGGVAFFKLQRPKEVAAAAPAPTPTPIPTPAPTPVVVQPPPPPPVVEEPTPAVIVEPVKEDVVVVEKKPQQQRRRTVVKKPESAKPVETKKPETKPTLPIERDIE